MASNSTPGVWTEASPVPEPPSGEELGLGLLVLGGLALSKRRRASGAAAA